MRAGYAENLAGVLILEEATQGAIVICHHTGAPLYVGRCTCNRSLFDGAKKGFLLIRKSVKLVATNAVPSRCDGYFDNERLI